MEKPEDLQELERRLPEIQEIERTELREEVTRIFLEEVPEYFWDVPASSTGKYHPSDHNQDHGLWIHTKRAFTAFQRLSRSYENQGRINLYQKECGKAAILLHDMFKYGIPPERQDHTVSEHDVIAARFLEKNSDLPEEVIGCVESHNGPDGWGKGKAPETDLEQIHHLADMIASDKNGYFKILKPSDELREYLAHPTHPRS